jgi:hypothetical protein
MNLNEIKKEDKTFLELTGVKYNFRDGLKEIKDLQYEIQCSLERNLPTNSLILDFYRSINVLKVEIEKFLNYKGLSINDKSIIEARKILKTLVDIENV